MLKQLKLPDSTATRRLTEMAARNPCAFLEPLIKARPAYADAIRLELKAFASRENPEFLTFIDYAPGFLLRWFGEQLADAPGGLPQFLLD